jgi:cyclopropane-fatty-acyl-phospholipid synthase
VSQSRAQPQPQPPAASARLTRRQRHVRGALQRWLRARGIELDGTRPYDVRVLDPRLYDFVPHLDGTSLRDAYVEGLWDSQRLDETTFRALRYAPRSRAIPKLRPLLGALAGAWRNPQTLRHASRGIQHYQLGEALFRAMLDPRMIYSCAYFRDQNDLARAQEAKLDLICRKLELRPGKRLLDVGCGWGGLAQFAARRYGVDVVGITLSPDQAQIARSTCAGLPVQIRLQSYHELDRSERFDAVSCIGMMEHVGPRNYDRYFRLVRRLLDPSGLFLLQVIGSAHTVHAYDGWMERNVFPNAFLPSIKQVAQAAEGRFIIEDLHNIGADYDKTLMAWYERFERAWPQLRASYNEEFHRMWRCYLLTCAGAFRARVTQLWQVVMSPSGVPGGYESVR